MLLATLIGPGSRELRIAGLLGEVANRKARNKQHEHRRRAAPTLAGGRHHFAERITKGRWNKEDRQQFQEIGKRRRILQRMGRVHIEKPPAIGAELLDGNLRRSRADRDGLFGERRFFCRRLPLLIKDRFAVFADHRLIKCCRLKERDLGIRAECLHDALRHQDEREHERQRQQDIDRAPRQIDPEVPDRARFASA